MKAVVDLYLNSVKKSSVILIVFQLQSFVKIKITIKTDLQDC